jgi:hypothetical protein
MTCIPPDIRVSIGIFLGKISLPEATCGSPRGTAVQGVPRARGLCGIIRGRIYNTPEPPKDIKTMMLLRETLDVKRRSSVTQR